MKNKSAQAKIISGHLSSTRHLIQELHILYKINIYVIYIIAYLLLYIYKICNMAVFHVWIIYLLSRHLYNSGKFVLFIYIIDVINLANIYNNLCYI